MPCSAGRRGFLTPDMRKFSRCHPFVRVGLPREQVRRVEMLDGVKITRSDKVKDELVLEGNDIELVSRSAALIKQVGNAEIASGCLVRLYRYLGTVECMKLTCIVLLWYQFLGKDVCHVD